MNDLDYFTKLAAAAGFDDGEISYLQILAAAGIEVIDFPDFLKPDTNDKRLHKFLAHQVDWYKVALLDCGNTDFRGDIFSHSPKCAGYSRIRV